MFLKSDKTMPILFCNIAWMNEYAGRSENDPPLGGGRYVDEQGEGGEELNFFVADDGYVYGYFATIKNGEDREVKIERLGASKSADYVDGVDVVWTAPVEGESPRCVIGWYRNARVYRRRQKFHGLYPSAQHKHDEIKSYRVRARKEDVHLIPSPERGTKLYLQRGEGWSGQASWWYAEETTNSDARKFVQSIHNMINGKKTIITVTPTPNKPNANGTKAGQAARDAYTKYFQKHEVFIRPRHSNLEKRFKAYLTSIDKNVKFLETYCDDMRYERGNGEMVMVEVKPTEPSTVRFAIRTAMGQLLDYGQQQNWKSKQLIVVETEVSNADDKALALETGFGLAWPREDDSFHICWPNKNK